MHDERLVITLQIVGITVGSAGTKSWENISWCRTRSNDHCFQGGQMQSSRQRAMAAHIVVSHDCNGLCCCSMGS